MTLPTLDIERVEDGSFFALASSLEGSTREDFIGTSEKLAANLARTQKSSSIPGGYFILLEGTYGEAKVPMAAVIKAEPHDALRYVVMDDGSVSIELLKSVFLSPSQKLLKIGILSQREEPAGDEVNDVYQAVLYDAQFRGEQTPAEYFYREFLGLTTLQNARIQSRRFFEKTEEFVRGMETTEFNKEDLQLALRNEFNSGDSVTLAPREFAHQHIPSEEVRQEYQRQVVDFMPDSFIVDPGLIQHQIRTRKIEFENKVRISGPEDAFNNSVRIIEQSQDHVVIRIEARRKY